ncbi:sensor histidine kinase [Pseudonocardia lacus]|uniref:sensor histidine kinase n=1 Tax=Pseudonocardia lacus TaxID=2835865 RepID=UPI001BDC612A|nr:HAMP domain-containing sensor histidine kinase [Pseudonocardia lacus]
MRRLPGWMQTIRFRLTATYSLVVFGLTAAVLGAVYAVVSQNVDAAPLDPITVRKVKQVGNQLVLREDQQFQAADLESVQQAVNFQTLEVLRTASAWVLAGLLVLSLAVGWWLSGRVLRPVRRVTAAAREIGATDLSRRIALAGPNDEIRSLADTVDDMLGRLDGAFGAQRRLIDDASHELRHPLAVIRTTLDAVLSRDDASPDERRRALAVVTRATARMTGLVEDLLAAARRAAPAFVETDVDLAAVVAEVADEYALLAGRAGVRIARRTAGSTTVIGDAAALRRAMDNLVSNALRVSPAGTTITVASGHEHGWAWSAVRDEGPGIADGDRERVFDRFWRGAGRAGPDDRGTGLGLAIVRQTAESHGGSVAVHSAPGAGSSFVIWVPHVPDGRTTRTPAPPATDPLAVPAGTER